MIQRKQSLYLLIITILMVLTHCFPLATILTENDTITLTPYGIISTLVDGTTETIVKTTQMGILTGLTILLSFLLIFFYRHRLVQIRLCYVLGVFLFGVQVFYGYYIFNMQTEADLIYSVTDLFPLISLILNYLAIRGIIKDEALINSLNRIR